MPADQGEIERQRVLAYGGSDNTRASFNRSRYTVHASKGDPRDLGELSSAEITVKGEIGAESGSQTLFFRFRAAEKARVEARGVRINRYTDQYISLDLRDESGIALTFERLSGETASAVVDSTGQGIAISYVFCGYWETGYAEQDCVIVPAVVDGPTAEELDSYFERIGATVPPGPIDLVVSSSQWTRLPYELQVLVTPLTSDLAAEAGIALEVTGSIALGALDGEASLSVPATGRLVVTYSLQGEAPVGVPARGLLERTSPFT